MHVNLRQLHALVALAHMGRFTQAAAALHVTPSALSGLHDHGAEHGQRWARCHGLPALRGIAGAIAPVANAPAARTRSAPHIPYLPPHQRFAIASSGPLQVFLGGLCRSALLEHGHHQHRHRLKALLAWALCVTQGQQQAALAAAWAANASGPMRSCSATVAPITISAGALIWCSTPRAGKVCTVPTTRR